MCLDRPLARDLSRRYHRSPGRGTRSTCKRNTSSGGDRGRGSVFAQSDGYPSSAHKIHRNNGVLDGAIVLAPGTPEARTLLFHFADQVF